jgi:hypothetical protein
MKSGPDPAGLNSSDPVGLNSTEAPENLITDSRRESILSRAQGDSSRVDDGFGVRKEIIDDNLNEIARTEFNIDRTFVGEDKVNDYEDARIDENTFNDTIDSQAGLDRRILQRDIFVDELLGYPLDSVQVARQAFGLVELINRQILEDKEMASEYIQDFDNTQN